LRGREFSSPATACRCSRLCTDRSVLLGKYWRSSPRWCSRCCRAARGNAGRRSRCPGRWPRRSERGRPFPCPGPRSATGGSHQAARSSPASSRPRPVRDRDRRAGAAASRTGWTARPGCRSRTCCPHR
jgi:hypothetical protein